MAIGELEPKQMRPSEQPGGEFEPDSGEAQWSGDVLPERADRIAEKLEQPLPADLVMDVDNYVGERMQGQEANNTLLGREVEEMLGSNTEESYIELVKALQEDGRREAKSLNDIARELPQLGDEERANKLQALKVFSLALNEMQPAHETAEEWEKLSEEEKDLVWVADITKWRTEIMAAEDMYKSDEVADKVKVKYAFKLGDGLRAYGKADELPAAIKEEFASAVNRVNLFLKDNLRTKMGKKVSEQQPAVTEGNKREDAAQAETDEGRKGAGEGAEETLLPLAGETIIPAERGQETPDQARTEQVLAEDRIEPAGEQGATETVKQRIFGREAIKKEDVKAIDAQLKELAEKGDAESAFELARELSHLRRAGIKLSGRGQEYYQDKLGAQVAAMRGRGARAVAQYHVYLKYLAMENEVSVEDSNIIGGALKKGAAGNQGSLAALAMNAKYLEVLANVDGVKSELAADLEWQGKNDRQNGPDQMALELARRKYLGVETELPEGQEDRRLFIDRQLKMYQEGGLWKEYVRLKSQLDYIGSPGLTQEDEQVKIVEQVEWEAQWAREGGDWRDYTAYVADAVALSRRQERTERGGAKTVEQMGDDVVRLGWVEVVMAGQPEEGEQKKGDEATGQTERAGEEEVGEEQYPNREGFNEKARKLTESQEQNDEVAGEGIDVLKVKKPALLLREKVLLRRRKSEEANTTKADEWANEAMAELREGADLGEVMNEDYWRQQMDKHKLAGPRKEARRQRYMNILRNEFGLAQMMDKPTVMEKATSLWMERWYARVRMAKGLGKLKAMWPAGGAKRSAWREVVAARQDMVRTMQQAANDGEVDGRIRALTQRLATEYELMNVRDVKQIRQREWAAEEDTERTREVIDNTVTDIEKQEAERAAQPTEEAGEGNKDEDDEGAWVDYV